MIRYLVSLDPAQLRDWSAIAVVKMVYVPKGRDEGRFEYELSAMNRKQSLPYDQISEWAVKTQKNPAFSAETPAELIIDATGVGLAVNDICRKLGARTRPIMITAGNSYTPGPIIHLGKAALIGTFLGALDTKKIKFNQNLPIWPELEREMLSYRAEMSAQGHAKFEAEPGEHDDMLFALAMAVWYGEEILRGKRL